MSDWIFRFVVGADSDLGGSKLRLLALTNDNRILQVDCSEIPLMPSSFAIDRSKKLLYVTDELNDNAGRLLVYSIVDENRLQVLHSVKTGGSNPCHVAIDRTKKLLYVSHYSGGGVICYYLPENGLIDEKPLFVMGKNRSYHCVLPLEEGFIALDSINNEMIHAGYSSGSMDYSITVREISSPRLAKFSGEKRILIVSENASLIYTYNIETGELFSVANTCIEKAGNNTASSIWISKDNRTAIVSNRGEDSLVAFDVEKGDIDTLNNPEAIIIREGNCPRDFDVSYDEEYAVVGFTRSNCVKIYKINIITKESELIASQKVIAPIGISIL